MGRRAGRHERPGGLWIAVERAHAGGDLGERILDRGVQRLGLRIGRSIAGRRRRLMIDGLRRVMLRLLLRIGAGLRILAGLRIAVRRLRRITLRRIALRRIEPADAGLRRSWPAGSSRNWARARRHPAAHRFSVIRTRSFIA